ncbi:pyridoxal phosphate-dependent aminotransferase [Neomegalonema perideroedes]|uniref:pyridoxal phosphate-dependent aminotransferase n=1 Tax=Neomegalonema perideroedes TaxID=217219 RepID=UPI000365C6BB|nr:aminotransferase class I/II-fold pyridoxal phosphate-dependent enzyme [Neomegalonema perideroedes]
MTLYPAPARRSEVDPFIVMDVMRAAAAEEAKGRQIIHMEVGQPAAPAPRKAREAVLKALSSGDPMGYTLATGREDLREALAARYKRLYGVAPDPEQIVVTTGSSGAFLLAFLALFDAGSRVAMADPSYPSYRNIFRSLNIEPVSLPAEASTRFQPTPAMIEAAHAQAPLAGILAASPANPTGTTLGRPEMAALIQTCAKLGIPYISDEIYNGILFEGRAPVSAVQISDRALIIDSFSKYHCMTGWRVGWMVVPKHLLRTVERLTQNHHICAPHVSQIAALGALEADEELSAHVATYARNREILLDALPGLGFADIAPADGAFYIWTDVSKFTANSPEFCARMLREAGVAATPGVDFDPARGLSRMRFSYARSTEDMIEGARRLKDWIQGGI